MPTLAEGQVAAATPSSSQVRLEDTDDSGLAQQDMQDMTPPIAGPSMPRTTAPSQWPTPLPQDPLEPRYYRVPMEDLKSAWHEDYDESTKPASPSSSSMRKLSSSGIDLLGPYEAQTPQNARRLRKMIVMERRRTGKRVEEVIADVMGREEEANAAAEFEMRRRQTAQQQECYTGNENLSCYPTSSTNVTQGEWGKFIWNKNYPRFTNGGGYVDIYLFHQDSDQLLTSWMSIPNDQGRISFEPTDSWWANRPAADAIQDGQTLSWPFYFAITSHGDGLASGTSRLATWHAIQTAVPATVAAARASSSSASMASVSAAASAASLSSLTATLTGSELSSALASAQSASDIAASRSLAGSLSRSLQSSLNADGLTGTETARGTATSTLANDGHTVTAYATAQANGGNLNNDGGGSNTSIPHWAIVLIAVLGFLAVVAVAVAGYFLTRWARRRRAWGGAAAGAGAAGGGFAASGSHGSRSPMMAAAGGAGGESDGEGEGDGSTSLLDGAGGHGGGSGAAAAAGMGAAGAGAGAADRRSSRQGEASPFSSDEASKMADAFRAALRKPAFALGFGSSAASSGNGSSGGGGGDGGGGSNGGARPSPTEETSSGLGRDPTAGPSDALLRDELASEGREMRSVDDRRRPSLHRPDDE